MMKVPVIDVIGGTTLRLAWVSSGAVPTTLIMNILDREEALVSSVSPVDSGNGHYFAPLYVPSSHRWYVGYTLAVVDARTYVNRVLIQTNKLEVD